MPRLRFARFHVIAWACLCGAGLVAGAARADVRLGLRPELTLGAGYDDNLFLDATPQGPRVGQVRSDAIFDIEPRVSARLSANHHALTLSVDDLERLTPSTGSLRDVLGRLDWTTPTYAGLWRLGLAALYERYQSTVYPDDAFNLGGGDASLRIGTARVRADIGYRADARVYESSVRRNQVDVEQRPSVMVSARLHRVLSVEAGYAFLHVSSTERSAMLDRHRVEGGAVLRPVGWLEAYATYGFQTQHLPDGVLALDPQSVTILYGPRNDLVHTFDAGIVARPRPWVALFARFSLVHSTSDGPTGNYHRNQLVAGVSFAYDIERTVSVPDSRAPELAAGRVTFHTRAHAGAVAVVGDWNGWDPAQTPLAKGPGDEWTATVTLPSGRHEYAFSIDGVVRPPAAAPAYVSDGFGGRNGVIHVP